jgi:hypothetical protein
MRADAHRHGCRRCGRRRLSHPLSETRRQPVGNRTQWLGQLGDGTTRHRTSPVKVGDGVAVCSAGDYHSLFVTRDGRLFAMGDIRYGQLGTGRTRQVTAPVEVMQKVGSGAAGGLLRSAALGFTRHPSRILPCDRFFSLGFFRCCHAHAVSGNRFQHQHTNTQTTCQTNRSKNG